MKFFIASVNNNKSPGFKLWLKPGAGTTLFIKDAFQFSGTYLFDHELVLNTESINGTVVIFIPIDTILEYKVEDQNLIIPMSRENLKQLKIEMKNEKMVQDPEFIQNILEQSGIIIHLPNQQQQHD